MRQKMQYKEIKQGYFLARPNRFIAHVELDGQVEVCHVKNTGRCRELLTPRAVVYVECHHDPRRKTKYSLIAVRKGSMLVNMDSQAPNKVVGEWLASGELLPGLTLLKPECRYGASRFDFYAETQQQRMFIEVKGVTLEENGVAMFPDAPTERGIKHLDELAQAVRDGARVQGEALVAVLVAAAAGLLLSDGQQLGALAHRALLRSDSYWWA